MSWPPKNCPLCTAAVRSDKCKLLEEEWRLVEGGDSDCSLVDDDDELGAKSEGH